MTEQKQNDTEISKHLKVLRDKLTRFLSPETPPDVLIIKAHLICEYYINQILILKELCSVREINKLGFYDKLKKVRENFGPEYNDNFNAAATLNKLRNKVGHELEYTLSESDVDELGFYRGKEYVLEKYDIQELNELLNNNLTFTVIGLSLIVFRLVETEKRAKTS